MGAKYLIDTNAIIDFFNGKLPSQGRQLLSTIEPAISIITRIELFSSSKINQQELQQLQRFVDIALIHSINLQVAIETIEIRKKYKIKLPDAIIAATAIVYNLKLVTRNVSDFDKISNLELINPYTL